MNDGDIPVKLISGDGFGFIISKQVAEQSPTLRNMLEISRGGVSNDVAFTEALTNQIRLPEIRGKTLEKVCQYLFYKYRFADEGASDRVPDFAFEIEMSLELLMAADYLDC
ncbi:elongin C [Coemansia guatemalensis]|uniref:Elongin-C n=1 Tax=Coemansia guatemalensis TaxID=2761395 RepID=A0A9W8HZP1_9FUNG|nr:elongin C [Coemansia guatemalensis]